MIKMNKMEAKEEALKPMFSRISGNYKIVQVQKINEDYLRFAQDTGGNDFHGFIMTRFVKDELGLGDRRFLPKESPYKMVGAGDCDIDLENKIITFNKESRSSNYGVGLDLQHLNRIEVNYPSWEFKYS